MRRILVAILVVSTFSGCTRPSDDGEIPPAVSPTNTGEPLRVAARAALPQWTLGQGWTYIVELPGKPTHTFKMMVAEDQGDLWVVASNNRTQALHHAVYSTNPVLGRISKSTLSPYQSGSPVKMFDFDLTDGKTWRAQFFGEDMTFTAHYAGDIDMRRIPVRHGLGQFAEGFRITAAGGTGQRVSYDYVEAVEWFTTFELTNKEGAVQIRLTLTDLESDYRGPYFFYRAKDALVRTATPQSPPALQTFDAPVPEDFKDLVALGVAYLGRTGTPPPNANVTLKKPNGDVQWSQTFSSATQVGVLRDFAGQAGTWKVEVLMTGTTQVELRVAGIQKFAEGAL